jgi:hypothetical protein
MSIIKITNSHHTLLDIGNYINSETALMIIVGIFLSIFIAFIAGAIVQYFTRLIFTYSYEKNLKRFGSVWGALAISAIVYFILIKGSKGTSFISDETVQWIDTHRGLIILYCFGGFVILLELGQRLAKLNIPKLIVLIGTAALALAFAGNDLVNFIGVPLAGLASYQEYLKVGNDEFLMSALKEPVRSNTYLLLLAGVIMIVTLWFSKKARKVVTTTVDLSRQHSGEERFRSSGLSRGVISLALSVNNVIVKAIPEGLKKTMWSRLNPPTEFNNKLLKENKPAFDMIRASVNLVVASILIAFGTSLKLPLSTTYVTFMVAMGTSLSDKAWGRESAVYRITGVFTVIAGWFMTAITALLVCSLFTTLLFYGGIYALILLILVALFFVLRTHLFFRKEQKAKKEKTTIEDHELGIDDEKIKNRCYTNISEIVMLIPASLRQIAEGLHTENKKRLKSIKIQVEALDKKTRYLKDDIHNTIELLKEDSISTAHYYILMLDYLRELVVCMKFIVTPCFEHINNHHKGITEDQFKDLEILANEFTEYYTLLSDKFQRNNISDLLSIKDHSSEILELIEGFRKSQIKRIRNREVNTRNSLLYLNILAELKNIVLYTNNLINTQKDFLEKT